LNLSQGLKTSVLSLFLLFFFCNGFKGQISSQKSDASSLTLTAGAAIYSEDIKFNRQIISKQIDVNNAEISLSTDADKNSVIKAIGKRRLGNGITVKNSTKRRSKRNNFSSIKKIVGKINDRTVVNDVFESDFINTLPVSNQSLRSSNHSQDFVHFHGSYKLSVIDDLDNISSIKLCMADLYDQKYFYYNNKSLNFCFSEIFSVRPPPALG